MASFPSADLTPAYPDVAPLGLGIGDVESFPAYVARLGTAFAVLTLVLPDPIAQRCPSARPARPEVAHGP